MSETGSINLIIGWFFGFVSAVLSPIFTNSIKARYFGPKFDVKFSNTLNGCLTETKERYTEESEPGNIKVYENDAYYIRLRVNNLRRSIAKQCRAYLVKFEKWDKKQRKFIKTIYCDSVQLNWSCASDQQSAIGPKDIPKGVDQFVDVISTRSIAPDNYRVEIQPMLNRYEKLFSEVGKFRVTIQVTGENVAPESQTMIFDWKGRWDSFEVN